MSLYKELLKAGLQFQLANPLLLQSGQNSMVRGDNAEELSPIMLVLIKVLMFFNCTVNKRFVVQTVLNL